MILFDFYYVAALKSTRDHNILWHEDAWPKDYVSTEFGSMKLILFVEEILVTWYKVQMNVFIIQAKHGY